MTTSIFITELHRQFLPIVANVSTYMSALQSLKVWMPPHSFVRQEVEFINMETKVSRAPEGEAACNWGHGCGAFLV